MLFLMASWPLINISARTVTDDLVSLIHGFPVIVVDLGPATLLQQFCNFVFLEFDELIAGREKISSSIIMVMRTKLRFT